MFGIPKAWLISGVAATVLGAFILGWTKGSEIAALQCETRIASMKEEAKKQADLEAELWWGISLGVEKQDEKARVIYRTITKEVEKVVERPIYRNVCIDDDGLRLINKALAGPNAAPESPANPR